MEVDLTFEIVRVENGVEVDELFFLVEDDDDCVLTKPIIPSTCGLGESLDGSLVGLGSFGISSYKVLD